MEVKLIKNPIIAKLLLEKGHVIVNLKPKVENPRESMFIFGVNETFYKDLDEIMKNRK